ncbi:MAG: AAA family ATPase [Verrucomicrobia bacterium]|nr:AAA family ATPase [Verrucomicrobiota bacterium]
MSKVLPSFLPETHTHHIAANSQTAQRLHHLTLPASATPTNPQIKQPSAIDIEKMLEREALRLAQSMDSIKTVDALLEHLPLEKLQDAVRIKYPSHVDALTTAKDMLRDAKKRIEIEKEKLPPSLRARLTQAFDALMIALDNLMTFISLKSLFTPSSKGDPDVFIQVFILAGIFSGLSMICFPMFGPGLGMLILTGIMITLISVGLIYPEIKRAPSALPKAQNWTRMIQQGTLEGGSGRKSICDQIAQSLTAGKKLKSHPLLIGPSGVGKTESVKAFAKAVERGDYPELAGKQVFYINTANIYENSKYLKKLSDAMGRHRENIILVFDEIHLACQVKEGSALGDQMKTLLDPGQDNLPYCIGMTTELEYYRDIYANNPAFARRFQRISVDHATSNETLDILNSTVAQQAPLAILEENVLTTLLEKTEKAFSNALPQPAASLKVLSNCIQRVSSSQKSILEEKIEGKQRELQELFKPAVKGALPYDNSSYHNQIRALENALIELEKELEKENALRMTFSKTRKALDDAERLSDQTILKVAKFSPNKELKRFLFLSHYLIPALKTQVTDQAKQLGMDIVINSEMVDAVIKEMLESDRKAEEIIAQGKKHLEARG